MGGEYGTVVRSGGMPKRRGEQLNKAQQLMFMCA